MTILRLIVLGLATAIRPTSLTAVGALLAQPTPRRFLTAYLLAGTAFTIAFGIAVIEVFHGVEVSTTSGPVRAWADVAAGLAAITFGILLLRGRAADRRAGGDQPSKASRWIAALDDHVSVRKAALAGPMTHVPGILYLLALDLIVTDQRSAQLGLVDLLIYNGLWFAVPIAALAVSVIRPDLASRALTAVQPWVHRHGRSVLVIICLTLGGALLVHGLLSA